MSLDGDSRKVQLSYGELTRLAAQLGRTPSHLSRHLSGERPSARLARDMAAALGIPEDVQVVVARRKYDADGRRVA